jgi:acyl-CoA synthetase (AMP-forming)/AMP-acid ligase II
MPDHPLSRRIADVLELQPDAAAIEYDGQWLTWGQVADLAHRVGSLDVRDRQVGILLRNRPEHVATLIGVLLSGVTVVAINPSRGDDRTRADIDAMRLPLIIGARDDLRTLVTPSADTTAASISGLDDGLHATAAHEVGDCEARPGVAVRMLTSGTTGPPKRIDLTYEMLALSVMGRDLGPPPTEPRRGVAIVNTPLSAEDADAFTEKYGIPVLMSYPATEFGGGVAGWTLADYHEYWHDKRGSVGRPSLGAELRVVDDDGTPLGPDVVGLLEVKPGQLGPSADWMRTTDMARIDADGFLWILGRADQAIIRGGFKVMPVTISEDESDQPEHRRGSFGKPAPGFDTKVINPDTSDTVVVGETGELCIRGPFMMLRYYKRSREECFDADGWFHTGDLVPTDDDGFVYFIGRRGAMIKTAGANVAPAEVERAIAKVTGGTVGYGVGIPDPDRGQVVAAVIALEDGADFDEAALRQRLKAELSAYKIPKRFAAVPRSDIPVLSSGKVDLAALQQVFDA